MSTRRKASSSATAAASTKTATTSMPPPASAASGGRAGGRKSKGKAAAGRQSAAALRTAFLKECQSIMYVAGASSRTLSESVVELMLEMTRDYLVGLVLRGKTFASGRPGSLSESDIIFLIKDDVEAHTRLVDFLRTKELASQAQKRTDDVDPAEPEAAVDDDDATGTPSTSASSSRKRKRGTGKQYMTCVYDLPLSLLEGTEVHPGMLQLGDDDEVLKQRRYKRLKVHDDKTKAMSRSEYEHYAQQRTAMFKGRQFSQWLADKQRETPPLSKAVLDVLGFVGWFFVRRITKEALNVRARIQAAQADHEGTEAEAAAGEPTGDPPSPAAGAIFNSSTELDVAHLYEAHRRFLEAQRGYRW